MTKEERRQEIINKIEDELLDLVEVAEDACRSDIQGVARAKAIRLYESIRTIDAEERGGIK